MTGTAEQLRRLKNTIMGAGHRLSLLAGDKALSRDEAVALQQIAAELSDSAQRLERLLSRIRARG